MDILLVVNKELAKNLGVIVRLSEKKQQKYFKDLISKHRFDEAFDFVFSHAEPQQYLNPKKENYVKAPDYVLVEDLIIRQKKKKI